MKPNVSMAPLLGLALLAGCDGAERGQEPPEDAAAAAEEPSVTKANAGKESVIRRSVLEETETEAEPEPKPERVEIMIPFADADGSLPAGAPEALASFLDQPAVARAECILISGHTDSKGSDRQNLKASQRRAELVRDHLVERGIAAERLRIVALGERRPIAPNAHADGSDFPEGRAKNRRVTIRAVKPSAGAASICTPGEAAGTQPS